MCRSCHRLFNSRSVFPVQRLWTRSCGVRLYVFRCVWKSAFIPTGSLGHFSPSARCCAHAVPCCFSSKERSFGKRRLCVSFQPLKACQVKGETKLSELMFFLGAEICSFIRPLSHVPKPLLQFPTAGSGAGGFCLLEVADPLKQPGLALGSSGVWGKQPSPWLSAFLNHLSRTCACLHL